MSTVPGPQTWQDAGLLAPGADPSDQDGPRTEDRPETPGEYVPDEPRPDLEGRADPADVAEQHVEVPEDEGEAYPS